jgi:two-component system sensor histidine kinase DesK
VVSPARDRPPISPQSVVLGVLVVGFAWAFVFPLRMTHPPSPPLLGAYLAGLVAVGAALLVVLHSAVHPGKWPRSTTVGPGLLVLACLGVWLPTYSWADPSQQPWAWLAGFAIGACALADRRAGSVAALVLGAAAAAGAAAFDRSAVVGAAIALGCALAVWIAELSLVWLLGVVRAAEAGKDAAAELAVAQERLRVSRELHDVLGHRLGIIALKAELAEGLAATQPQRAAAESAEIRSIAATTLAEARRAVHGDTVADLASQLSSAELVLRSAGIDTTVDVDPAPLPPAASQLLATVVREAVTNLLRHADARTVSITYDNPSATLVITNDGVGPGSGAGAPTSGTGLAALAERCREAGARFSRGPSGDDRFEVRVVLSADAATGPRPLRASARAR